MRVNPGKLRLMLFVVLMALVLCAYLKGIFDALGLTISLAIIAELTLWFGLIDLRSSKKHQFINKDETNHGP